MAILCLKQIDFFVLQGSGKSSLAKRLSRAWKCELINGKPEFQADRPRPADLTWGEEGCKGKKEGSLGSPLI